MVFTYVHSGRPLARCYPKMRCRLKANHFTMPNLPPEPWTRLSFSTNRRLHYFGGWFAINLHSSATISFKNNHWPSINHHGDPPGDGRRRSVSAVAFPSIPHRLGRPFLQLFFLMFLAESKEKERGGPIVWLCHVHVGGHRGHVSSWQRVAETGRESQRSHFIAESLAYLLLEICTTHASRKAGGTEALPMLVCAVDSNYSWTRLWPPSPILCGRMRDITSFREVLP